MLIAFIAIVAVVAVTGIVMTESQIGVSDASSFGVSLIGDAKASCTIGQTKCYGDELLTCRKSNALTRWVAASCSGGCGDKDGKAACISPVVASAAETPPVALVQSSSLVRPKECTNDADWAKIEQLVAEHPEATKMPIVGCSARGGVSEIWWSNVGLTGSFTLSNLPDLSALYLYFRNDRESPLKNKISEFYLSDMPSLRTFGVSGPLTKISDLSGFDNLENAAYEESGGVVGSHTVRIERNPKLKVVDFMRTSVAGMVFSDNPSLEAINIYYNPALSSVSVSGYSPKLVRITAATSSISHIDLSRLSGASNIHTLDFGGNALTAIPDVSPVPSVLNHDHPKGLLLDHNRICDLKPDWMSDKQFGSQDTSACPPPSSGSSVVTCPALGCVTGIGHYVDSEATKNRAAYSVSGSGHVYVTCGLRTDDVTPVSQVGAVFDGGGCTFLKEAMYNNRWLYFDCGMVYPRAAPYTVSCKSNDRDYTAVGTPTATFTVSST